MYVVFAMLVCYFGLNGGLAVPWWISDSLTKGNQHFAFDDIFCLFLRGSRHFIVQTIQKWLLWTPPPPFLKGRQLSESLYCLKLKPQEVTTKGSSYEKYVISWFAES